MLKFLDVFRRSTAAIPDDLMHDLLHGDEPIYMTIEFRDNGHLLHNAVVTAHELERNFGHHDCDAVITGYMSQADALKLTLEERGMAPPPLLRHPNIPQHIWDDVDDKTKAWLNEHERLHEVAFAEYKQRVAAALDLEEYRWGV